MTTTGRAFHTRLGPRSGSGREKSVPASSIRLTAAPTRSASVKGSCVEGLRRVWDELWRSAVLMVAYICAHNAVSQQ